MESLKKPHRFGALGFTVGGTTGVALGAIIIGATGGAIGAAIGATGDAMGAAGATGPATGAVGATANFVPKTLPNWLNSVKLGVGVYVAPQSGEKIGKVSYFSPQVNDTLPLLDLITWRG
jgi:hypothetical protein